MNGAYSRTRTADGRTAYTHRLVWERAHGPIPAGMNIHHKNGNKRDNRIENLELIGHAEHAREHMTAERMAQMAARIERRTYTCEACGGSFLAKQPARACSTRCKSAMARARRPEKPPKRCLVCSAPFKPRGNQRTCSKECGKVRTGLDWVSH